MDIFREDGPKIVLIIFTYIALILTTLPQPSVMKAGNVVTCSLEIREEHGIEDTEVGRHLVRFQGKQQVPAKKQVSLSEHSVACSCHFDNTDMLLHQA